MAEGPASRRPTPGRDAWWGIPQSIAAKAIAIVCALGLAILGAWKLLPESTPVRIPEGFLSSPPAAAQPPPVTGPGPEQLGPHATYFVHVAGAVHRPGLVELPAGGRVADALDAAGGPLEAADLAAINLAAQIADGEQIYLPTVGEESLPAARKGPDSAPALVNINTADESQLQQLPGIGPVMAGRIIAYRADHGPFGSVDDLQAVAGIGPVLLAQLRSEVTV